MNPEPEAVRDFLRQHRLRVTPQRLAIIEALYGQGHLPADAVYRRAHKRLSAVSRATVYNTLQLLVRHGAVRALVIEEGHVLYDANLSAHHHFVCEDTGEVHDVPAEWVRGLKFPGLEEAFEVSQYSIVFRGRMKSKETGAGGNHHGNGRAVGTRNGR